MAHRLVALCLVAWSLVLACGGGQTTPRQPDRSGALAAPDGAADADRAELAGRPTAPREPPPETTSKNAGGRDAASVTEAWAPAESKPPSPSASGGTSELTRAPRSWGEWRFVRGRGDELIIYNVQIPEGVIHILRSSAAGSITIKTGLGAWIIAPDAESRPATVGWSPPPTPTEGATLGEGVHRHGGWRLEITGEDMHISHPRASWTIRLWRDSNGWVDFEGPGGPHTIYSYGEPWDAVGTSAP